MKYCHECQHKDGNQAVHQKSDSFFGRMFFRVSENTVCLKSFLLKVLFFYWLDVSWCCLILSSFPHEAIPVHFKNFYFFLNLSDSSPVWIYRCLPRPGLEGLGSSEGRVVLAQTALSGGGSRCRLRGRHLPTFRVTRPWVQGMHLCVISSICLDSSFWHVTLSFSLTCRSTR